MGKGDPRIFGIRGGGCEHCIISYLWHYAMGTSRREIRHQSTAALDPSGGSPPPSGAGGGHMQWLMDGGQAPMVSRRQTPRVATGALWVVWGRMGLESHLSPGGNLNGPGVALGAWLW